jgi:hypothetical protein
MKETSMESHIKGGTASLVWARTTMKNMEEMANEKDLLAVTMEIVVMKREGLCLVNKEAHLLMMIQSMARHLMEARMTREDLEEILCMVKMMTINLEKTEMAKAVTILAKDLLEEEMEMMMESMVKAVKDQALEDLVMKVPAVMKTTKGDQDLEVRHMAERAWPVTERTKSHLKSEEEAMEIAATVHHAEDQVTTEPANTRDLEAVTVAEVQASPEATMAVAATTIDTEEDQTLVKAMVVVATKVMLEEAHPMEEVATMTTEWMTTETRKVIHSREATVALCWEEEILRIQMRNMEELRITNETGEGHFSEEETVIHCTVTTTISMDHPMAEKTFTGGMALFLVERLLFMASLVMMIMHQEGEALLSSMITKEEKAEVELAAEAVTDHSSL